MKEHLLSIFALIAFSSFTIDSFTEIINAIKSGNATEVARYFDNNVEITTPQNGNSYSKSKAEEVLHDFFNSNFVKDFKVIHMGENERSQYCIGNLLTNNGTYRTTIYTKQKGGIQLIQEIRFEK
jgi:chemotaxis protein CheY-P-specific phosphatase CheC